MCVREAVVNSNAMALAHGDFADIATSFEAGRNGAFVESGYRV
jgi:hypothetical protein